MAPSFHRAADSLDLTNPPQDSPTRGRREPPLRIASLVNQQQEQQRSSLPYTQAHYAPSITHQHECGHERHSLDGSERSFNPDPFAPDESTSDASHSSGSASDHPCAHHQQQQQLHAHHLAHASSPSPFRPHFVNLPHHHVQQRHFHPDSTAALVASGSIGMGYGPYATREAAMNWRGRSGQGEANERGQWTMATDALEEEPNYFDEGLSRRTSVAYGYGQEAGLRSERQGVGLPLLPQAAYTDPRFRSSQEALVPHASPPAGFPHPLPASPHKPAFFSPSLRQLDEKLHSTRPVHPALHDPEAFTWLSLRGWLNASALVLLFTALLMLFVGFPILQWIESVPLARYGGPRGYGVGRNSTRGDVPIRGLIDEDTPQGAKTRVGFNGQKYELVFSDEFNTPNRTFWPGDDPYWEAVDLHYYATNDLEYYHPDQITTHNGSLVITIDKQPAGGLEYVSGMLQGWNKFCYSGGGYVEVAISLPGSNRVSGLWPSAWTMGNLARAGFGATTEGTWPYSYSSCDVGTLPNQTYPNATSPTAALSSGLAGYDGSLSYQPGQRLSACSCPAALAAGDHPGPSASIGRGAPEIDILEAQISYLNGGLTGTVSQSAQFAPYDAGYQPLNVTGGKVVHQTGTYVNSYVGQVYQEAVSAVSPTDGGAYELGGGGFASYGVETWAGPEGKPEQGYMTWQVGGEETWTLNAAAVGPNAKTEIGQRLVTQEPMYVILNLGMSEGFQTVDYANLEFPAKMLVDYVRVYQREGEVNVGCDPKDHPTGDYIEKHLNAYMNLPTLTDLPSEVLLLIAEALLPAEPTANTLRPALLDLHALCLAAKVPNSLVTAVLYRHVRLSYSSGASEFLRTAESARWMEGDMRGRMRGYVRSLHVCAADTEEMRRILAVVEPGRVVAMELGLRYLRIDGTEFLPDHDPATACLPNLTHLRICNLTVFRQQWHDRIHNINSEDANRNPNGEPELTEMEEWDPFLSPEFLPALTSLRLDPHDHAYSNQGYSNTPTVNRLCRQLTDLTWCEDGIELDTESPETYQSLVRLRRLALSSGDPHWVPEALEMALAHLPGSLERLDLSGLDTGGIVEGTATLCEAIVRGAPAVAELAVLVVPGEGAWGEEAESVRVAEVGALVRQVGEASRGRVRIEYSAPHDA